MPTHRDSAPWIWLLSSLLTLVGCAPQGIAATEPGPHRLGPATEPSRANQPAAASTGTPRSSGPDETANAASAVIAPGEVVPAFALRSTEGTAFDSAALVGKQPFVVVFFASWCGVCHVKIPLVQRVLAEVGDGITTIGVALDEPESWSQVGEFVDRYGLTFPIVRGEGFERFVRAFNPAGGVPAVLVVAHDGKPIQYQLGVAPSDPIDLALAVVLVNERAGHSASRPAAPLLR